MALTPERFYVLLYNAITYLETEDNLNEEEICHQLGITDEEYNNIIKGES